MFYLLLTLGLVSTASGVFVIIVGIPIRETTFGSALLVAGSVALAAGFVTVGLAAAVAELRLVILALKARMPAVPRPLRPVERVERKDGEKRSGPPRNRLPPRPAAGAPPPVPPGPPMPPLAANREPSAAQPEGGRILTSQESARARPEWLRRAFAELSTVPKPPAPLGPPPVGPPEPPAPHRNDLRTQDGWPHLSKPPPSANFPPVPDVAADEPRRPRAPLRPKTFDMTWPSGRGGPAAGETPPEMVPSEPSMRQPEPRPAQVLTPSPAGRPPAPASPPRSDARPPRPPSILKSGVIDEMAYTLFTDGSIEAQLPEGTTRFASIEELREHLEKREGEPSKARWTRLRKMDVSP